jgi:hypothetical protein
MRYTLFAFATGLMLLSSCKKEAETVVEDTTIQNITENIPEKDMCFLQVTSKDSVMLAITRDGDNISGTYRSLPYEKDKKINVFKGSIHNNIINAVGTVSAEGMTSEEEIIITLENNQATVKVGEMIEGDDSVYRYKNKNTAYSQVLSKVDCK